MVHILKVFLKKPGCDQYEIRRTTDSTSYTSDYNLLCEKIMKMFPVLAGKCFVLQWIDSDGDKITMSSNEELDHAVSDYEGNTLKIYVQYEEEILKAPECSDSGAAHSGVVCDACNSGIVGIRYKCLQCPDFDLCHSCSVAGKHSEHDMIKLVSPATEVRNWLFPGWRKMWKSMFGFHGFNKRCFEGRKHYPHLFRTANCGSGNNVSPSVSLEKLGKDLTEKVKKFSLANETLLRNFVFPDGIQAYYESDTNSESEDAGACGEKCKRDKKCKNKEAKEEVREAKCTKEPECNEEMKVADKVETTEQAETSKPDENSNTDCKTIMDPEKEEKKNEDMLPSYPEVTKASNGARPKTISPEKSAESPPRESTPSPKSENSSEKLEEDASSHVDGWTILNAIKDDFMRGSSKFVPFPKFLATDAFDKSTSTTNEATKENRVHIASAPEDLDANLESDEAVLNALLKMKAMGFSNEGGWLERLLQTKKGNINEALDSLYPYTARQ